MGPWVRDIDPIIGTIAGVHLWWYGLSYSLGFLNAHLFFMRRRGELGLSAREVYDFSLLLSAGVPPGGLAARFLFLYAFARIFIDYFREYPLTMLGLPAGQTMNLLLSAAGIVLLLRNRQRPLTPLAVPAVQESPGGLWWRRAVFAAVVTGSMVIASDATRDIPAKYGKRHPELEYSRMYPPIPNPPGER